MQSEHLEEAREIHHATMPDWREIDRNLRRIAGQRAALDAEEARWLREAVRGEVWHEVGAATLLEYLEDLLGYTPRAAADRVRVALALGELPALSEALEVGALPFTAVRELVRVATPATEAAWLADARGKNVHQIEQAVSGHARGDLPGDPPRPELELRVLRFEVRPETFARFREAQQVLETESGMRLDDDAVLAALCAAVLEPREPARAQHQIHTIECARCGQGWQDGAGTRVAIDATAVARADCDAERIDPVTHRAAQDVTPKVRRLVWHRDGGRCAVPGCRSARHVEMHHIQPRALGGGHTPDNLTLLCGGHHRALHDGHLAITGPAPALNVRWTHAGHAPPDKTHVGHAPEPAADVVAEVRTALITMGYKRREAAAAVEHARNVVGSDPTLDRLIRAALRAAGTA